jgi:hypothetical protein
MVLERYRGFLSHKKCEEESNRYRLLSVINADEPLKAQGEQTKFQRNPHPFVKSLKENKKYPKNLISPPGLLLLTVKREQI